jgi:transcriptional regulator with XRE-family HTH domain
MTYKEFCKKIGGLIRLYRVRKNIKLNDFASELDVKYQHVQQYENGDHLPRFHTMLRIVKILDIPANKIFGKEADNLDLQELSKEYSKYREIIEGLKESKELRELAKYYIRNKDKFEDINLVNAMESIAKIPKNKR